MASFALAWGDGIDGEYKKALKEDIPFVTHIAEGFDEETMQRPSRPSTSSGRWETIRCFVHCIAFSDADLDLIKQSERLRGLVRRFQLFMYNKTMDVKMLLDKGINLCIGTDSPMREARTSCTR